MKGGRFWDIYKCKKWSAKKKKKKKRNKIHDIVLFIYIILHEETMHVLLFTCESAEMIGKSGLLLSLL